MKSTVFRYGMYATLIILGLGSIHFFFLDGLGYGIQEVIGYLTMLLSMIFVFVGIRHFRNHVNNGTLTFGEGLKVGLLIVLIPAVFFGLFDVLLTEVINPGWKDEYFNYYVEKTKSSTPPDQVDAALKKLKKQREMFGNPAMQFLIMFGTVFVIGMIVTIISALSLRKTKTKTAIV